MKLNTCKSRLSHENNKIQSAENTYPLFVKKRTRSILEHQTHNGEGQTAAKMHLHHHHNWHGIFSVGLNLEWFFFILEGGCGRLVLDWLINTRLFRSTHTEINACMSLQASVLKLEAGEWNRSRERLCPTERAVPSEHTPSQPCMFNAPPAAAHMHESSPLIKKKTKQKTKEAVQTTVILYLHHQLPNF